MFTIHSDQIRAFEASVLCGIGVVTAGVLVLVFKKKAFRFSSLNMMLAMGLSYMAFILLGYSPSIRDLLGVFFFF